MMEYRQDAVPSAVSMVASCVGLGLNASDGGASSETLADALSGLYTPVLLDPEPRVLRAADEDWPSPNRAQPVLQWTGNLTKSYNRSSAGRTSTLSRVSETPPIPLPSSATSWHRCLSMTFGASRYFDEAAKETVLANPRNIGQWPNNRSCCAAVGRYMT